MLFLLNGFINFDGVSGIFLILATLLIAGAVFAIIKYLLKIEWVVNIIGLLLVSTFLYIFINKENVYSFFDTYNGFFLILQLAFFNGIWGLTSHIPILFSDYEESNNIYLINGTLLELKENNLFGLIFALLLIVLGTLGTFNLILLLIISDEFRYLIPSINFIICGVYNIFIIARVIYYKFIY